MIQRLLLILAIAFAAPAAAATYTVTADRDAYLRSNQANNNFGSVTDLEALTAGNSRRPIIGFTLPSIPAGEMITSAMIQLTVTQAIANSTVALHRVTDSWAEGTVTWSNTSADFNAAAEVTVAGIQTVGATASFTVTSLVNGWRGGTITNDGVMLIGAAGTNVAFGARENATAASRPQLIITTVVLPVLTVLKSSTPFSDPYNGTTNPKAVPGAAMTYTITASNSANGTADNDTTVITDAVPGNMELYVGNIGGAGSGPVSFVNGSPSSGLSYTFTSLASATDSIAFSNNGGASYAYTPVPDGNGYDAAVTNFRISPSGSFAAKTGAGNPSFSAQLRMRIK